MIRIHRDISRHVGEGVVHWNGRLSCRPVECRVLFVERRTRYSGTGSATSYVWCVKTSGGMVMELNDSSTLFRNSSELYEAILDYVPRKALENPAKYGRLEIPGLPSGKDAADAIRRAAAKDTSSIWTVSAAVMECLKSLETPDVTKTVWPHHPSRTCAGFIREMMRHRPDIRPDYVKTLSIPWEDGR